MRIFKRRGRTVFGGLVLAAAVALVPAASASAVSFPTAHTNSATSNLSDIGADMTANSPASVAPGDSVSLSSIDQTLSIPPDIFVTGYCLFGGAGLITPGLNTFPADASTEVEATNTVEGTQRTNIASDVGEFTITDPTPLPGTPCGGDETSTPGTLNYTYADQTWTAGGSPGSIEFRMDTVFDPVSLLPTPAANGILIDALIGGVLGVQFRGAPGIVDPATLTSIIYDDPAVSFASTTIAVPNQAPIADAGADQSVASEQAGVTLDGTGSSDPDGDPLTYSWTQTAGPSVTLSGANTATASFDAPVGPESLEFQLEVCDGEPLCDTDSTVVTVEAPVVEVVDAGAELIVNGPTRSAATKKGFVVRVTNLGTGPVTIDPATDTSAEVTVNGSPAGSVELKSTNPKTLSPGARTRFRYQWNLEGSAAPGDTVVYSGTVSVADDADPGNDTDSATATAR